MQTKRIEESKKSYFVSYAVGVNSSNEKGDETALIIHADRPYFFILNGDWTNEYKKCKTKKAQINLFRENYTVHAGFWTDSLEELDALNVD